jgi:four helix bundle protein
MKVKRLEELRIWQQAREFARAVSAILQRPSFRGDRRLKEQLGDSSVSVLSNISEGFGQPTDRAFAHYVTIARTSNNEAISQLAVAAWRGHITEQELEEFEAKSCVMGKGMTSLIAYLRKTDQKERG